MLNVFFTVDVEIWCGGWQDLDQKFPDAFRRYVYGPTSGGDYGLPFKLKVLNDYGLTGVFFVEPLFASRFGVQPLQDVVGLIQDAGQEVQLHLHTEWVDEAKQPLLDTPIDGKRQFLRMFSTAEQTQLIAAGLDFLHQAGVQTKINAFRAGSFGFNQDTLPALAANDIAFDSSYDVSYGSQTDSGLLPEHALLQPIRHAGVYEYPMTVFIDHSGGYRHAQLGACSFAELQQTLYGARDAGWDSVVLLSHNFELMNQAKTRPDPVVIKRFTKLCDFLNSNRDSFSVKGFLDIAAEPAITSVEQQPVPLRVSRLASSVRLAEQLWRRRYG